jgi:hypothetical protein
MKINNLKFVIKGPIEKEKSHICYFHIDIDHDIASLFI